MALLKIRVELQRPRQGIEMSKLADLSRETQKLFRLVADDIGLNAEGTWVAKDFYNQGIGFDATFETTDIDESQASSYVHVIDQVSSVDQDSNWYVPRINAATLIQLARLARVAGDDETVRIGLYNGKQPALTWRPLTKSRAAAIVEHFQQWVQYRGMAQGPIHSLYKESQPPYFDLRDLVTNCLIKCFYQPSQYAQVHAALERKDAVVIVSGLMRVRRQDRQIGEIAIERIQSTKAVNQPELERFFGSAPDWTGDLPTEEFIERVRNWNDAAQ